MNLETIEKEIRQVLSQIESWQGQSQIPSIEKGIAMTRLQKAYDLLMENEAKEEQAVPAEGFSVTKDDAAKSAPAETAAHDNGSEVPADGSDAVPEDKDGPAEEGQKDDSSAEVVVFFEVFGEEILPQRREEFVNRLFKGDADYFEAELAKLERMDSLDDALIYIGEQYDWHPDDATANHFIELMVEKLS